MPPLSIHSKTPLPSSTSTSTSSTSNNNLLPLPKFIQSYITDPRQSQLQAIRTFIHISQQYHLQTDAALTTNDPSHPFAMIHGQSSIAVTKNRYCDIIPFDHNRVKLLDTTISGSDYINASYIRSLHPLKTYIAAQGPMRNTIRDFWQMVYEQNCGLIVMLTREVESERVKCDRYWPVNNSRSSNKSSLVFMNGRGVVTLVSEESCLGGDVVVRTFKLSMQDGSKNVERVVKMLHFLGWPDHGVCDSETILKVVELANELNTNSTSPMVVHCSAGVGRTGTFCIIDSLLALLSPHIKDNTSNTIQVSEGEILDIHQDLIVKSFALLRSQRVSMVQTKEQFVLLYEAVARGLLNLCQCN